MTAPRTPYDESYFFHASIPEGPFVLDAEESRHLRQALRIKEGEIIYVTDGAGTLVEAEIGEWNKDSVTVRPLTRRQIPAPAPQIDLAVGMVAKPAVERLLEHVCQLPLARIFPLATEFTQIKADCFQKLIPRYQRLSLAALKQSKKTHLTQLQNPVRFDEVLNWINSYDIVYFFERSDAQMKLGVEKLALAKRILLLVGPEGGFSVDEMLKAREKGALVTGLGETRLRAETAGFSAVVSILTLLGRMV